MTRQAIVTRPRGSWKWQDAYAVATYEAQQTRDGRWIWRNVGRGPKRSKPQLRGTNLPFKSLHNVELTPEEIAQLNG